MSADSGSIESRMKTLKSVGLPPREYMQLAKDILRDCSHDHFKKAEDFEPITPYEATFAEDKAV